MEMSSWCLDMKVRGLGIKGNQQTYYLKNIEHLETLILSHSYLNISLSTATMNIIYLIETRQIQVSWTSIYSPSKNINYCLI